MRTETLVVHIPFLYNFYITKHEDEGLPKGVIIRAAIPPWHIDIFV